MNVRRKPQSRSDVASIIFFDVLIFAVLEKNVQKSEEHVGEIVEGYAEMASVWVCLLSLPSRRFSFSFSVDFMSNTDPNSAFISQDLNRELLKLFHHIEVCCSTLFIRSII